LGFLPTEALSTIAMGATSSMTMKRSREGAHLGSTYRPVTPKEILLWIAQRVDIALNIKIDIKDAYASVRSQLIVSSLRMRFLRLFTDQ
jgi:hypothetical protein